MKIVGLTLPVIKTITENDTLMRIMENSEEQWKIMTSDRA